MWSDAGEGGREGEGGEEDSVGSVVPFPRELLAASQEHAATLSAQCLTLERQLARAGGATTASLRLLQAQLGRDRVELATEQKLGMELAAREESAELGLAEAELALGKFEEAGRQVGRAEGE